MVLIASLIWSGNTPGSPVAGPPSTSATLGVVVMIELSALVSCSWWIWLSVCVTSWVALRRNARGTSRCFLLAAAPKFDESTSDSRHRRSSRSLARHVDLVVHHAARAAQLRGHDDQVHAPFGIEVGRGIAHVRHQRVQVRGGPAVGRDDPGRNRDVQLILDHVSDQPIFAKTVSKNSVPPAPSGTGVGRTAPVSVSISSVARRKNFETQRERDRALVDAALEQPPLVVRARPSARTGTARSSSSAGASPCATRCSGTSPCAGRQAAACS